MRRLSVVACLLGLALIVATPAKASEISFVSQSVGVGDPLGVDVVLSGNTATLLSFGFFFSYDPTVLRLDGAVNGTLFPPEDFLFDQLPGGGSILNLPVVGFFTGNGLLATLSFTAIAAGDPLFTVFDAFLTDAAILEDPNTPPIVPDIVAGTISVTDTTPVPEPSTLGLLGLGVLSLARRLRRRSG